jgi:hypothetical protein
MPLGSAAGLAGGRIQRFVFSFSPLDREDRAMKNSGKNTAAKLAQTAKQPPKMGSDAAQRNVAKITEGGK